MLALSTAGMLASSVALFLLFSSRFYSVYRQQAESHLADVESIASENVSELIEKLDQLSVSVLVDRVVQDNLAYMNSCGAIVQRGRRDPFFRNKAAISGQVQPSVYNVRGVVSLRIYSIYGEEIFVGTSNQEYLHYSLTPEEIYKANGAALWEMNGEKNYICLCRAILSTSTMLPQGYMVIVCRNDYFSGRLATLPQAYSSKVYLVDDGGRITASNAMETVGGDFPCLPSELGERRIIADPLTGEQSFFFTVGELANGWTLVTTITAEKMLANLLHSILGMAAIWVFVLALVFLITKKAVRRMAEPTQTLLNGMRAFGEGALDSRVEITSQDEIGKIGEEYNHMADNIQNLMEQVYTLELANKEAEIEFLKMQINPHFLYNTLDTISWLGFTYGSEEISNLAVSLARLLRSSIKSDDFITVERELETVKNYLEIQRYRFEDRFSVVYEVEDEACKCYMPNFLLQPLIENSIMHGLEEQMRKGTLWLRIQKTDWLCFEVADDGKGMDETQVAKLMEQCRDMNPHTSIGLRNVYRRLYLLYGEGCGFTIKSAPDKGTSIFFRIPLAEKPPV